MNVNAVHGIGSSVTAGQVEASLSSRNARASMFSRKSSMCLGVLFAAGLLSSGAAVADLTVPIDAAKNCLDIAIGTFPFGASVTTSPLAAGTYIVSLRDNTMSCYAYNNLMETQYNSCHIDKVLLRGVNSFQAGWGLSVGDPVMINVTAATVFNAFVVDTPCNDNVGKANLFFKGPL